MPLCFQAIAAWFYKKKQETDSYLFTQNPLSFANPMYEHGTDGDLHGAPFDNLWIHDAMRQEDAETLIEAFGANVGTYLIRRKGLQSDNTETGPFALSVCTRGTLGFEHHTLAKDGDGGFAINGTAPDVLVLCNTLGDVVAHLSDVQSLVVSAKLQYCVRPESRYGPASAQRVGTEYATPKPADGDLYSDMNVDGVTVAVFDEKKKNREGAVQNPTYTTVPSLVRGASQRNMLENETYKDLPATVLAFPGADDAPGDHDGAASSYDVMHPMTVAYDTGAAAAYDELPPIITISPLDNAMDSADECLDVGAAGIDNDALAGFDVDTVDAHAEKTATGRVQYESTATAITTYPATVAGEAQYVAHPAALGIEDDAFEIDI